MYYVHEGMSVKNGDNCISQREDTNGWKYSSTADDPHSGRTSTVTCVLKLTRKSISVSETTE
jgi:hypothetical protein